MSALDGVLADLVEADPECSYVTVERQPLETLIEEWLSRGDHLSVLCNLAARARDQLALFWATPIPELIQPKARPQPALLHELNSTLARLATAIAHHRHAVRQELAARIKQALRSAIAEIHQHVTDALLKGNSELAERLESERQTVQIVISAIDATVSRMMTQELARVSPEGDKNVLPPT
jgi:hypothetical protein